MFMNESTENLLDNLENELTEVIELESLKIVTKVVIETQEEKTPPIPAKRNFIETCENLANPIPTARRLQSLDKSEKNDENEIIQLSSMSSSSASENRRNISQDTIVVAKDRSVKPSNHKIIVVQESETVPEEETFYIIKHGKWAKDSETFQSDNDHSVEDNTEVIKATALPTGRIDKQQPHLEVVSEKPTKIAVKNQNSNSSSPSQSSIESSSEYSSSSEESLKTKKKLKQKLKGKRKNKSKKKLSSEDQTSSTENSNKDIKDNTSDQAIGIFLHSTGALRYDVSFKRLRVKVSLYNEDTGKQISDSSWTRQGTFNDDFHNLICTWNEMLTFQHDLSHLKEIYNNVVAFFEVINSDENVLCWAFLKLFTQQSLNIDDKFQLQFFQHQKPKQSFFMTTLRQNKNQKDLSIYEQWRMIKRKKFPGILNVTIKVMKQTQINEPLQEPVANAKQQPIDNIIRKWQKLPGQACKIPNKTYHKISFFEKGSMNVKFSQDGNLIAFTEVTKDGTILHIQKFPEMQEVFTMLEHSDLIHDIDWLKQKHGVESCQWMLTGSSDFTAIVWKLEASSYTYNILPHPSFVYASKFLQSDNHSKMQVVTAGRDCVVRIWQNRKKQDGFELIQELNHPNGTKSSYITTIATRNAETFYTSSSQGDVIEWTFHVGSKGYHLNRHFKLLEISGKIITSLELHPRGNKLFLRIQDFINNDITGTIFVLGVPTGLITQRFQQPIVKNESQGKLKITTCGTHLFSSNGSVIRFYSLLNGNLTSVSKNFLNVKIPSNEKISSMDYHSKDFYFACSIYGRNGGVIISTYEPHGADKDLFDKLKIDSNNTHTNQHQVPKATGTHFADIIRKLDEVFLAPIESDASKRPEILAKYHESTCSDNSKRSRTYTVSQGPATYTIQRSQNNTYEVQPKDDSEDDTTITESLN